MRSMALARSLLADATFTMDHGRLGRLKLEIDRYFLRIRAKVKLPLACHLQAPGVDPRQAFTVVEARLTKRAAARLLCEIKTISGNIRDGEVRELQIVCDKAR